jgi:hypothetical protein
VLIRIVCRALVVSSLIHVGTAAAQDRDEVAEWAGEWVFMAGWQRMDASELNARLNTSGFPSFSESLLSLGGGGWAFKNDFLIGGNGHALFARGQTTTDQAFRTDLGGGYGQADFGYRVYTSERLDLYPVVGFGAGAVTLEIVQQGNATFDGTLSDPLTMTRLTSWGFLLDLAAAADVRVTGARDDDGMSERTRGGFSMGVRAGYAFWPGDWTWDAAGGPGFAVRGVYVRVMVGGWAR